MMRRLLCLSLTVCCLALCTIPLRAQTNSTGLRVEPAFQEVYLAKDQESTSTEIKVVNDSDVQQQIELSAVDFRQTDALGSLAFLEQLREDLPHTLAAFMRFDQLSIIVEPHSEKKVTVFIDNRQNLPPGGHYGAIIIRSNSEEDVQQNNTQKIIPALASLILLKKEGEFSSAMSLSETSLSKTPLRFSIPLNFRITLKNEGNIHEVPRGQVKMTDLFNRVIAQGTINESSLFVLPENRRNYPLTLKRSRSVFPIMLVNLNIEGYAQGSKTHFSYQDSFLFIHPAIIVILILLILIAIFIIRHVRKRKTHYTHTN